MDIEIRTVDADHKVLINQQEVYSSNQRSVSEAWAEGYQHGHRQGFAEGQAQPHSVQA